MNRPHFHIITLFPNTIESWLTTSMMAKAYQNGLYEYDIYDLKQFAKNNHHLVDDTAYGGGAGMVLKVEPLVEALEQIQKHIEDVKPTVIYFSPTGRKLNYSLIRDFNFQGEREHYVLVCGHYEGVDQRFIDHWVDLEISLGDFVLTGGELPALCFIDACVRQLEGALGPNNCVREESFSLKQDDLNHPLLEYPQYTRPAEFRGHHVPEVLLSGDHEKIKVWRKKAAQKLTENRRPDLIQN